MCGGNEGREKEEGKNAFRVFWWDALRGEGGIKRDFALDSISRRGSESILRMGT